MVRVFRKPLPSFCIQSKFSFPWKPGVSGHGRPHTLRHRRYTRLHSVSPKPMRCESTQIPCSWDIEHAVCNEVARDSRHIRYISPLLTDMLQCPIRLHLQNTSSKVRWLRISRWQQQNKSPAGEAYSVCSRAHTLELHLLPSSPQGHSAPAIWPPHCSFGCRARGPCTHSGFITSAEWGRCSSLRYLRGLLPPSFLLCAQVSPQGSIS